MSVPYKIVLIIIALVGLWFLSGVFGGSGNAPSSQQGKPEGISENFLGIQRIEPLRRTHAVVLNGATEAHRQVEIKAEVEGRIVELPVREGSSVKAGEVILKIDPRNRREKVQEALALVKQRDIEYAASKSLEIKGFRTEIGLAEARANLEKARTELKQARLELANTEILAPFDGVVEQINVEVGDFANSGAFVSGSAVALFVEPDPLLVTAYVSERDLADLRPGQKSAVKLGTGQTAEGVVSFVGTVADATTRSFRVEVEVPNPERSIPVGVSAELRIEAGSVDAYPVPSSALALDDAGQVGIKVVNEERVVEFLPVTVMDQDREGTWISGPQGGAIELITQGGAFVYPGQKVEQAAPRETGKPE